MSTTCSSYQNWKLISHVGKLDIVVHVYMVSTVNVTGCSMSCWYFIFTVWIEHKCARFYHLNQAQSKVVNSKNEN